MSNLSVGSIVRCRNREWIILPSADENLILLRPLTGSESEVCGIYKPLINLGFDRVEAANFPLPKPDDSGDAVGSELLWNAARLSLRDGAGPFRSLGRVSVRPRAYQFVPLLMSLWLQPIRLFIADDVGVGKTIEALLIVRELLDRGEIRRLCVLCPPYLCDQWQQELEEKFHINAVVIRSGTIGQLERQMPSGDHSVFSYFPYTVVSIDYAKSDRHRSNFALHCPELVIVDEAHGAAQPSVHAKGQQQRHELLKEIARDGNRHMILLTATPHSGVEESFRSLLGLLKPEFAKIDLQSLSERDRVAMAQHFIQRRRGDVEHWIGEDTPFPERDPKEETYDLSSSYRSLFEKVYEFSHELVKTGESLTGWKRRIRFWTALALLRCVMSSPAAAITALEKKVKGLLLGEEATDETYSPYIYEHSDEETVDVQPTHIVEEGESDLNEGERRRLREFSRRAEQLKGEGDKKLLKCIEIVRSLLRNGFHPIVWCRYIATSDYVAEEINRCLAKDFSDLRVISITGTLSEEERRERVKEIEQFQRRVLVATDCLSEGINLQDLFSAAIHYDLPWNPNRLEQREGRVDQLSIIPPHAYNTEDFSFISPRVMELVYSAWDIKAFVDDVWRDADESSKGLIRKQWEENNRATGGHEWKPPEWAEIDKDGITLPPFKWDDKRRAILRAELDAYYARLYGLTRDELRYILDPKDVYGPDFPGETFRVLKEKEEKQYGEYRTRRLVLEAWDRLC